MKEAILSCVRNKSFATFQDLTREVPGLLGDRGMFSPVQPAFIIWHAVSKEGIVALGDLIGSKAIFMHPAPRISYRADMDRPTVPVTAKKRRALSVSIEAPTII